MNPATTAHKPRTSSRSMLLSPKAGFSPIAPAPLPYAGERHQKKASSTKHHAGRLGLQSPSLNLKFEAHQMLEHRSREAAFKARLLIVVSCRSHDANVADRWPSGSRHCPRGISRSSSWNFATATPANRKPNNQPTKRPPQQAH